MVSAHLSEQDRTRIAAAIRQAESRTSGEIVCVVARVASDYAALPYLWSVLVALLLPWGLIAFTHLTVQAIFAAQLAAFALAFAVLSIDTIRVLLAPRAMRRAHAHRAAMDQFMIRGLGRTRSRTGVLIFVSLAEHYARIVADDAVAELIPQKDWQSAIDVLIAEIRQDRLADGLVAAIDRCGALLAEHLPARGANDNELPDRLYLI
jgi:putative membrane protein